MHKVVNDLLISLEGSIRVSAEETAFSLHMMPKVFEIVSENQWIVLGGDVLTTDLKYTCDNWYYQPVQNLSLPQNVKRSIETGNRYISEYSKRNGSEFLCVLVISNSYIDGGS